MEYRETPLCFDCRGQSLVGILSLPVRAARVGVVIVVGGPQYRVGSHRQFVHLARALAEGGFACLRFDYRGMGDSEGDPVTFEATRPDIAAAVGALLGSVEDLESVVLWGLCDGASACSFAGSDPRVAGLVLFNPWVRTDALASEATVRHYYVRRWLDPGFWRKLGAGKVRIVASLRNLIDALRYLVLARIDRTSGAAVSLPDKVGQGISEHRGPVLVVLSGNDQTAAEFRLASARPGALRKAMERPGVTRGEVPEADHTLSASRWRDAASAITLEWLRNSVRGNRESPSASRSGKEFSA